MRRISNVAPLAERTTRAMSVTRATWETLVLWTAATVLVAAWAAPAAAGHGAVSYENPKKIAEQKKREAEAAQGVQSAPPAAAHPAAAAPPMATPAGAVDAPQVPGADRDYTFASAMHRQLSDATKTAEDQVANGKDPKLNAVAKSILENNREQLAELDRWMTAHPPR